MDNRKGEFLGINDSDFSQLKDKEDSGVFKLGEILEVRGSRLRVEKILRNKLHLKLLPRKK